MPDFCNPYSFVPTPKRGHLDKGSFPGDYDPSKSEKGEDHSRYWKGCYTGIIPVKLKVRTPLFITKPNSGRPHENIPDHKVFDCHETIPPTALKGMLRSAYEIITNSRFGVFNKKQHQKRLGFRKAANGNPLIPARVILENGNWKVELFRGTKNEAGFANLADLNTAWLPVNYDNDGNCVTPLPVSGEMVHGVTLRLHKHTNNNKNIFNTWVVTDIPGYSLRKIKDNLEPLDQEKIVSGYVVVSGRTIGNKHDERFFFGDPQTIDIEKVKSAYEELIYDYQELHRDGNLPPGSKCRHGAHITEEERRKLRHGEFVYAKATETTVEALYPVQISRELYNVSPLDCIEESLLPPESLDNLSPGERLFGWVNQKGSGAWKGKIRISEPHWIGKRRSPVESFKEPVPLAILGAPKPAQVRFYLGDDQGNPQKGHQTKERAGYSNNKRLRGRKVYLHHKVVAGGENENYWQSPWQDRTTKNVEGMYQEYRQPGGNGERTKQNRSITGWMPRDTEFSFDIYVENLTPEELGALLTLLSFDNTKDLFRLGYAKPLGLGSVSLSLNLGDKEVLNVCENESLRQSYADLRKNSRGLSATARKRLMVRYKRCIAHAYGEESIAEGSENNSSESWRELDFLTDLISSDELQKEFASLWNQSLAEGEETFSMESFSENEILEELLSEGQKPLIQKAYEDDLKLMFQALENDGGWKKLPFIASFLTSLEGNEHPVHYPRKTNGRSGEIFEWFKENEKKSKLSLPEIGKPFSED
nr:TIGR03986 family CRISPR-associated RAMP protein [uncultured Dethiosulfovibrio sp.]